MKNNSNCEKQVIRFLMIPNGEGCKANFKRRQLWHYFAVKKLSALLSKNNDDFYYLDCLHSFRTKIKLESYKVVSEDKNFCKVIMPPEDTKILEFNQYQKSDKAPIIFYADVQCVIKKIDRCKNNLENSFTTKVLKSTISFV